MSININTVTITGNLTRSPELRQTNSGTPVCSLRVAVNGRRKVNDEWLDDPGFYDVVVWGKSGENCAKFLDRGRPVAISGRLSWREWTDKDGNKRQSVEIVGETVQFLGDGKQDGQAASQQTDVPGDDFATSVPNAYGGAKPDDDTIPFLWEGTVEWGLGRVHENR